MTLKDRQKLAAKRFEKCLKVLELKGSFYNDDNDANANIKRIAKLTNSTPESACMNILWNKIYKLDLSKDDEDLTDAINYIVIYESLIKG